MSLIALYGDTQQESHPQYSYIGDNGRSVRFEENLETNLWVLRDAKRRGATSAWHLGDGVENKNPNSLEMEALGEQVAENRRLELESRWIAGNHDGAAFDVSGSAFKPLALASGGWLKVYHAATYDPDVRCIFLPYIHNADHAELKKLVQAAYLAPFDGDRDAFLAHVRGRPIFAAVHYGFTGAKAGAKNLILPGDYIGEEILGDDVDVAFGGHIHKGQDIKLGRVRAYHPGSTCICDIGERNDIKSYLLFDTETRKVERVMIPQKHRWVLATWPIQNEQEYVEGTPVAPGPPSWGEGDIIKFEGERERDESPTAELERMIAAGAPRPFYYDVTGIKLKKPDRVARDFGVDITKGARDSLLQFAAKRYPDWEEDPAQKAGVLRAIGVIKESALPVLFRTVMPVSISAKNILTFKNLEYDYRKDEVTLIVGDNGKGKTNFGDLPLVLATGETSKGIDSWLVVRQGETEGQITGHFLCTTPAGEEKTIRITRSYKLKFATPESRPKCEEKLRIDDVTSGTPDKNAAAVYNDGGETQKQAMVNNIFGGGFRSLRVTNFQRQKTDSGKTKLAGFLDTDPGERKGVISEVRGDDALLKNWAALDKGRQETDRILKAAEDTIRGMEAIADATGGREQELLDQLAVKKEAVTAAEEKVAPAETEQAQADEKTTAAEEELRGIDADIRALPNTAAALASAESARESLTTNHTRNRAAKGDEYRDTKARLTAVEEVLLELKAPTQDEVDALEAAAKAAWEKAHAFTLPDPAPNKAEIKIQRDTETRLVDDIKKLQAENITTCPTCKQAVDRSHLAEEIERLKKELQDAGLEFARLTALDATAHAEWLAAQETYRGHEAEVQSTRKAADEAREAFARPAQLQGQATELRSSLTAIEAAGKALVEEYLGEALIADAKVTEARTAHESGEAKRIELDQKRKQADTTLTALRRASTEASVKAQQARQALLDAQRSQGDVERDIKRMQEQSAALIKARTELGEKRADYVTASVAADLLNPKDGLPVVMIDDDLLFLEDRANTFFEKLGGETLIIEMASRVGERETLDILIDNQRGGPRLPIECYSGGQKDRIQIAVQRALAELKTERRGVTFLYLGVDEPTGGLNSAGKAALADQLYEDVKTYRVISLTSHDPEFMQRFDRRVKVISGGDQETVLV